MIKVTTAATPCDILEVVVKGALSRTNSIYVMHCHPVHYGSVRIRSQTLKRATQLRLGWVENVFKGTLLPDFLRLPLFGF